MAAIFAASHQRQTMENYWRTQSLQSMCGTACAAGDSQLNKDATAASQSLTSSTRLKAGEAPADLDGQQRRRLASQQIISYTKWQISKARRSTSRDVFLLAEPICRRSRSIDGGDAATLERRHAVAGGPVTALLGRSSYASIKSISERKLEIEESAQTTSAIRR